MILRHRTQSSFQDMMLLAADSNQDMDAVFLASKELSLLKTFGAYFTDSSSISGTSDLTDYFPHYLVQASPSLLDR